MSCNYIVISNPDPTIEKDLLGCDPPFACPFPNSVLEYNDTKWQGKAGTAGSLVLKGVAEGSCIPRSDGGGTDLDTVTFLLSAYATPFNNVEYTCQRFTDPNPQEGGWDCVLGPGPDTGKTEFSFTGGEKPAALGPGGTLPPPS